VQRQFGDSSCQGAKRGSGPVLPARAEVAGAAAAQTALVAVLEGMVAGVEITTKELTTELARRKLGQGRSQPVASALGVVDHGAQLHRPGRAERGDHRCGAGTTSRPGEPGITVPGATASALHPSSHWSPDRFPGPAG
jgi:hypothetical protein